MFSEFINNFTSLCFRPQSESSIRIMHSCFLSLSTILLVYVFYHTFDESIIVKNVHFAKVVSSIVVQVYILGTFLQHCYS